MNLSIIIPIKDEAGSLPELLAEIKAVILEQSFEVIAIDDGSRDNSWEILQNLSEEYDFLKIVRFQYNCGKAAALSHGFNMAKGRYIATIDGDLQDNPAEIPEMLKMLESCDLVSGWKKKRYDPWHKTIPSKFFNFVVSIVCGQRLHDFNCGLKVYKAEVAKGVRLYGDFHRFIPLMASWNGYRIAEKAVEHRARRHGVSKYGFSRFISGFLDLLTLMFLRKFAIKPLHFFGTLGLLMCLVASVIFCYFGLEWFLTNELRVRPLLVLAGFAFVAGVQFISLGLLGEMLNSKLHATSLPAIANTETAGK